MKEAPALKYATLTTPIGEFLVVVSPRGLRSLKLIAGQPVARLIEKARAAHPDAELAEDEKAVRPIARQIEAVIAGRLPADKVPLDLEGTAFQQRVWRALVRVPWGKTCSYSELASKVGKPQAVRAVASACARNQITFVVPCHRIVRKGGGLGGYYWGLDMKERLLQRER